ncbi:DUF763 domain-containing protein [Candidatus Woesearchaeota archaeon]|nr:DUF763 domain-containing protein [Candidatus Woesearchaeota archaeon]
MRTGTANLPLHGGSCPSWLFPRMRELSGLITEAIVDEYGKDEFLRRIADPFFLQSLSCVIGFDWHSSGTTTTTMGALKEAVNKLGLGITICGGKGKTSRKAPQEIIASSYNISSKKLQKLVYSSRMAAKVDSNLLQDGYNLYHHCFIFTEEAKWAVVQQGMADNGYARRYHWLSDNVASFVNEPHESICGEKEEEVLDMTACQSEEARRTSVDLINDNPVHLRKYLSPQLRLNDFFDYSSEELTMPAHHPTPQLSKRVMQQLQAAYEIQPQSYEELASLKGIGAKSIRALALVSELIYGAKPSWNDPVKFSYAHGGKDGFPYPIDQDHYDKSIAVLSDAVRNAKMKEKEKIKAIKKLRAFIPNPLPHQSSGSGTQAVCMAASPN